MATSHDDLQIPNPIITNALLGNHRTTTPYYSFEDSASSEENFQEDETALGLSVPTMDLESLLAAPLPSTKIKRNYSCSKCSFFTQNPRTHLYHGRQVHGDKGQIFECKQCVYASKHGQKLQRHISMCHTGNEEEKEEGEVAMDQTPDDNNSNNGGGSGENYDEDNNNGNGEMETEEGTEQGNPSGLLTCKLCPFKTTQEPLFAKHMKTRHESGSVVTCNLCDFSSTYKWNLDRHLRSHGGKGAFKCPMCSFTARFKQSISVHISHHHFGNEAEESDSSILKTVLSKETPAASSCSHFKESLPLLVDEEEDDMDDVVPPEDIMEKNGKIYFKKLKCPNCEFRAVWETELNRHLSKEHAVPTRRCMPTLVAHYHPTIKPKPAETTTTTTTKVVTKPVATAAGSKSLVAARAEDGSVKFVPKSKEDISGVETKAGVGAIRAIHHKDAVIADVGAAFTTRKVYKCWHAGCNFWATAIARFHVHTIGHANKKPFECSECHYKSNWSWDVSKHIRLKGLKDGGHLNATVLVTAEDKSKDYEKNSVMMKISYGGDGLEGTSTTATTTTNSKTSEVETVVNTERRPLPQMPKLIRAPVLPPQGNNGVRKTPPPIVNTFVDSKNLSGGRLEIGDQKRGPSGPLINGGSSHSPPKKPKLSFEQPRGKSWKCKMCPFRHEDKGQVVVHIRQFHRKPDAQKPGVSSATFSSTSTTTITAIPESTSTSTTPFKETHQYTFRNEVYSCKFCPYKTKEEAGIEAHSENHFSKPHHNFACDYCSYSVGSQADLNEHIILHTPDTSQEITPEETPPRPPGAGSGYKKYHCQECPYVTDSRGQFQYHKQFHVKKVDSTFKCDHCSYNVSHKHLLHQHSRVHFTGSENSSPPQKSKSSMLMPIRGQKPSPPKSNDNHPSVLVWRDGTPYKVYRCHHCPQIFEDITQVLDHEREHEDDDSEEDQLPPQPMTMVRPQAPPARSINPPPKFPLSICKHCPTRFFSPQDLLAHTSCHRIPSPFKCKLCSFSAKTGDHLINHTKTHGIEYQRRTQEIMLKLNKIKCPKCPARLPSEPAFLQHYGHHGRRSEFRCSSCDFGADSENSLMLHEFIHSIAGGGGSGGVTMGHSRTSLPKPPRRVEVDEACVGNPNFIYPTYVKKGGKGETREKRYKCVKCPSAFEKRDQYNIHMGLHGANQRYRCSICDYSVTYYANFAQHLKKHESQPEISKELLKALATPISKMGNFGCERCPYMAKTREELAEHECGFPMDQEDEDEGQVACQFCDFIGKDDQELVQHSKCHFQSQMYVSGEEGMDLGNGDNNSGEEEEEEGNDEDDYEDDEQNEEEYA